MVEGRLVFFLHAMRALPRRRAGHGALCRVGTLRYGMRSEYLLRIYMFHAVSQLNITYDEVRVTVIYECE
jgi:hypothetical protein